MKTLPPEEILETVEAGHLDRFHMLLGSSLVLNGVLIIALLASWGLWAASAIVLATVLGILHYADKHS